LFSEQIQAWNVVLFFYIASTFFIDTNNCVNLSGENENAQVVNMLVNIDIYFQEDLQKILFSSIEKFKLKSNKIFRIMSHSNNT
jgi:hypothetical protein